MRRTPEVSAQAARPARSLLMFPPRQQEYVDYVMRHFQGKEKMTRSQDRLRFHLPMRIIPL